MRSSPSCRNMLKQRRTQDDLNQQYADHLEFLWEQYNKLMGLGVLASGLTLGFLLKEVIFSNDFRDAIKTLKVPLDTSWLIAAIVSAGLAAVLFITSRWCSQVLMERQVYGRYSDAMKYFQVTLDNETILPTALQPKKYMRWIERKSLLSFVGNLNECTKLLGIFLIVFSWLFSFVFAWPLIKSLAMVP